MEIIGKITTVLLVGFFSMLIAVSTALCVGFNSFWTAYITGLIVSVSIRATLDYINQKRP